MHNTLKHVIYNDYNGILVLRYINNAMIQRKRIDLQRRVRKFYCISDLGNIHVLKNVMYNDYSIERNVTL